MDGLVFHNPNASTTIRFLAAGIVLSLWLSLSSTYATSANNATGDDDGAFAEALVQRQLDELFEAWCKRRLADADLAEPIRVQLSADLAARLLEQGVRETRIEKRAAIWKRAHELVDRSLARLTDEQGKLTLRTSSAALDFAEARAASETQRLAAGDAGPMPVAVRQRLAGVQSNLRAILGEVERLQRAALLGSKPPDKQAAANWTTLAGTVAMWLGFAEVELAEAMGATDPEARPLLDAAVGRLESTLRGSLRTATEAEVLEYALRACRMAGLFERGQRLLASLKEDAIDAVYRDLVVAEQIELWLDEGRVVDALRLLQEKTKARAPASGAVPPRWQYLSLRARLQQAQSMKEEPDKAARLQSSAFWQLRRLEEAGDPIWYRRGQLLIARFATSLLGVSAAEYAEAARIVAQSGDLRRAADIYRQGAEKAARAGNFADDFQLSFEAARSRREAGDDTAAGQAFFALAERHPAHSDAADALHEAIGCFRRLWKQHPTTEDRRRLEVALARHRKSYPNAASAGDVLFVLGEVLAARGNTAAAIATWQQIDPVHRQRKAALLEIGRAYDRWIEPFAGDPLARAASLADVQAAVKFNRQLLGDAPVGQPWTPDEVAEITLRLARLLLDEQIDDPHEAAARLDLWLNADPKPTGDATGPGRQLFLVSLALTEQKSDAEKLAMEIARGPIDENVRTVELLNRGAVRLPENRRRSIGMLQRLLADAYDVKAVNRTPAQQLDWQLAAAEMELNLAEPNNIEAALASLVALKASNGRDVRVRELLARALEQAGRRPGAVAEWRELVAGLTPRTFAWFRAKLQLVGAMRRSGETKEALETITGLQSLYPEFGGENLKKRFLEEKARCERRG